MIQQEKEINYILDKVKNSDANIVINPLSLTLDSPAKYYTSETVKLVPGQVTIHHVNNNYNGQLNEKGMELLEKCRRTYLKKDDDVFPIKAELTGKFQIQRTGMTVEDGLICLNSFENRNFEGTIINIISMPEKFKVNGPIATGNIIIYEIGENNHGWIYTQSGSFYLVNITS